MKFQYVAVPRTFIEKLAVSLNGATITTKPQLVKIKLELDLARLAEPNASQTQAVKDAASDILSAGV